MYEYGLFTDEDATSVALHNLLSFDPDAVVQVKMADMQKFLRQISMGCIEPGLDLVDVTEELERLKEDSLNCFAGVPWMRCDILDVIESLYGICLDGDSEAVEDMVEQVIDSIGRDIEDRSIELGFRIIEQHLPDREKVMALAKGGPSDAASIAGAIASKDSAVTLIPAEVSFDGDAPGTSHDVLFAVEGTDGLDIDGKVFFSGYSHGDLVGMVGENSDDGFTVLSVGEPYEVSAHPDSPEHRGNLRF